MAAETTSQIAGEAEAARERISATIDELQDRLNPRRIVGEAVASVQASGTELINTGLGIARAHPVVLATAGLAIGLALLGNRKLRGVKVNFGDQSESYSDYDDDYDERAAAGKAGGERFALVRGPSAASGDNALIGVVAGLAAGALIGALFPETERERRLLGASADRLGAAARAAARTARDELGVAGEKVADVAAQAKSAVQSVVQAAKGELHG